MTATVQQLKKEELKHEGCVELLEALLEQARQGTVVGLLVLVESRDAGYDYKRVNIGLERTMGLLQRMVFKTNELWNDGGE